MSMSIEVRTPPRCRHHRFSTTLVGTLATGLPTPLVGDKVEIMMKPNPTAIEIVVEPADDLPPPSSNPPKQLSSSGSQLQPSERQVRRHGSLSVLYAAVSPPPEEGIPKAQAKSERYLLSEIGHSVDDVLNALRSKCTWDLVNELFPPRKWEGGDTARKSDSFAARPSIYRALANGRRSPKTDEVSLNTAFTTCLVDDVCAKIPSWWKAFIADQDIAEGSDVDIVAFAKTPCAEASRAGSLFSQFRDRQTYTKTEVGVLRCASALCVKVGRTSWVRVSTQRVQYRFIGCRQP